MSAPPTNRVTTPPPNRTSRTARTPRPSNTSSAALPAAIADPNQFDLAAHNAKVASQHPDLILALRCLAFYTRGVYLRPNQERALCGILNIPQHNRSAVVVQRTGAGKTIIVQMLGAALKGITLIVSPLLGLTSNLAPRFASDNTVCGAVDAIHLDEEADSAEKIDNLIASLGKKKSTTNNTSFILTSPQFLSTHTNVRDALLKCLDSSVLRAIVNDEAHLLALQGSDFRDDIRAFARTFLRPALNHANRPYFVGLSATLSKSSLYWLEQLIGFKISPFGKLWDSWYDFQQRNIDMSLAVTRDYKSKAATTVSEFFSNDEEEEEDNECDEANTHLSGAVVFVNSRTICRQVAEAVESELDKKGCGNIDVVTVHGHMEKEEKFFNLATFCTEQTINGYDTRQVRCFVSTSSSDHGIDHLRLLLEVICEWPESIMVYLQRRGRLVRAGGYGVCQLLVCFENFIYLYIRAAMRRFQSYTDDTETERGWEGVNAIYSPTTKKRKTDKADDLTASQRSNVANTQCQDLMDMARLVSMDHGCWHLRLELFCQSGVYTTIPDNLKTYACQNKCPNCRRAEWNKTFRRIDVDAMKTFLDSGYVRDAFPISATSAIVKDDVTTHSVDVDALINLIWKNHSVLTNIYDVKPSSVKRYNVEMLVLAMICSGIIDIVVASNGSAKFTLARVTHQSSPYPIECYKIDHYWNGISKYDHGRKRNYKQTDIIPNSVEDETANVSTAVNGSN